MTTPGKEEEPDPSALAYCAEPVEAFLGRLRLENEILFAHHRKAPLPEAGRR